MCLAYKDGTHKKYDQYNMIQKLRLDYEVCDQSTKL